MGVDRWTYLGPYAELPVLLTTVKRDMCSQPASCPNPTSGMYCPQCGMQVNRRFHEFQSADPPIPDFLFRALDEAVSTTDGMGGPERIGDDRVVYRLIGNQRRASQPREFHLAGSSDLRIDLTAISFQDELAWFRKAYAPEWMKIQEQYGGLIFRWGFLQWFT